MEPTAEDLQYHPYYDVHLGRVFTPSCPANVKLFREEFRASELGQRLKSEGLDHSDNLVLILSTAQQELNKEDVNMTEMLATAKRLYLLGSLQVKRQPVAQAPAPKQLSSSQLAWQEYRIFTEANPVAACKARAARDEGYRKFLHTNLEREMNDTPVEDAVAAVGTQAVRQDKSIRITEDLRIFADAYRRTSVAEVKRLSTPALNPVGYKKYTDQLDACIACGLI